MFITRIEQNVDLFNETFLNESGKLIKTERSDNEHQIFIKINSSELSNYQFKFSSIDLRPNCFPVFNLELHTLNQSISNSKVEPFNLKMPDKSSSFYGLLSVEETSLGDFDTHQTDVMASSPQNIHLYSSDFNRLSYADVDEIMNKLILKYDTEPLAFEKYRDVIEGLKSKLKYRLYDRNARYSQIVDTDSIYLFYTTNQFVKTGSVEVNYLTTCGRIGNGFGEGNLEKLSNTIDSQTGNPLEIDASNTKLITKTIGGRDALSDEEKRNEFWNVFYSRGSIITMEDVRNYCYHFFGTFIKDISINKRYVQDDLIPVRGNVLIDVLITILLPELKDQKNRQSFLNEAALLQQLLNNRANASLNEFVVNLSFASY